MFNIFFEVCTMSRVNSRQHVGVGDGSELKKKKIRDVYDYYIIIAAYRGCAV